jgi:hypothetical protein
VSLLILLVVDLTRPESPACPLRFSEAKPPCGLPWDPFLSLPASVLLTRPLLGCPHVFIVLLAALLNPSQPSARFYSFHHAKLMQIIRLPLLSFCLSELPNNRNR